MSIFTVTGVDPGLVHTGIVQFRILPELRQWSLLEQAIPGIPDAKGRPTVDVDATVKWCLANRSDAVFVEAYRPRSHLQNDARMGEAVSDLRRRIPNAKSLDNTGVKQVVLPALMKALDVWQFTTKTHHQDLRAAARIGLYGLLKNEEWNPILDQLIQDHIDGKGWSLI